jgi:hypothetical protein
MRRVHGGSWASRAVTLEGGGVFGSSARLYRREREENIAENAEKKRR